MEINQWFNHGGSAKGNHLLKASCLKVKNMQRSGAEAIRTQIKPSKPKRNITNISNSQNTKRTHGQPSEQLFPKRCPLKNRTKNNMNTRKVKRHRHSDTKNPEPSRATKKCSSAFNHDWVKTRHVVCRIMSKLYSTFLKRLTIRLKRLEKFGFFNHFLKFIYQISIESKIRNTLL